MLVLPLLTLALGAAASSDPIQTAATTALEGKLSESRSLLAPLIAARPPDVRVFFILACVELEDGNADAARASAQEVAQLVPKSPEARVLTALVELRSKHPAQRWTDAFIDAVNGAKLDCPEYTWFDELLYHLGKMHHDPASERLLPAVESLREPLAEDVLSKASPSDRFLLKAAETKSPESLVAEAIAVAAQDAPLTTHLVALGLLQRTHGDEATAAAGALLHRLAKLHPDDMTLRLEAALFGSSKETPFSSIEVAQLEEIAASAHFEASMKQVFEALRAVYLPIDPSEAAEAAFSPSCIGYGFITTLRGRALAVTDESLRARLSAILARIGGKLRQQPTLLDRMVSRNLMTVALTLHETPVL